MREAAPVAWRKKFLLKPEILGLLEEWFDPSDPEQLQARYDEAIAALESPEPAEWLAVAAQAGLGEDDTEHFNTHWLGEAEGQYWSNVPSDIAAGKIGAGFGAAMRTAREQALPISYVWVAPPGLPEDFFEIGHVAGPNGVTAIIVTSMPETRDDFEGE
jgi:hypothetical protein